MHQSDLLIRKLRKKLRQIENLERLERDFTEEEESKINEKDNLRLELQQLLKVTKESMVVFAKQKTSSNTSFASFTNETSESDKDETQPSVTVSHGNRAKSKAAVVPDLVKELKGVDEIREETKIFEDVQFTVSYLQGHYHDTCAVDLHGDYVVSGGRDTSLKLWLVSSNEEVKSVGGHDGTITGVFFMRDKPFNTFPNVITSSLDCSLRVWDLDKGDVVKSIYVYSPIVCLDYSNNIAAVGTESGKLILYNVETSDDIFSVIAYQDAVSAVKVLADDRVACGSTNGVVKVFSSGNTTPDVTFDRSSVSQPTTTLSRSKINCMTCWKNLLIFGDDGYNMKVVDLRKGDVTKLRNNVKEYCPTEVLHVAKYNDRPYLFSVGSDVDNGDAYINVRSLPDLKYIGTIHDTAENSGPITCLHVAHSDSLITIITGGSQLRVWSQAKQRATRKRKGSREDESLIPCKFICAYNEAKESETESECESESQASLSESDENVKPTHSWCTIL